MPDGAVFPSSQLLVVLSLHSIFSAIFFAAPGPLAGFGAHRFRNSVQIFAMRDLERQNISIRFRQNVSGNFRSMCRHKIILS
jgi:hypothetical protein